MPILNSTRLNMYANAIYTDILKRVGTMPEEHRLVVIEQALSQISPRFKLIGLDELKEEIEEENFSASDDPQENVGNAILAAMKGLNRKDVAQAFKNGLDKADPGFLRFLAKAGGVNLEGGEPEKETLVSGANLIILRPHPLDITPEQEVLVGDDIRTIVEQIKALGDEE